MDPIFLHIYSALSKSKRSVWLCTAVLLCLMIGGLSQLKLEEDISTIMPADEGLNAVNAVFDNSDLTDRLVVLVEDSAQRPERLKAFAQSFEEGFQEAIDTAFVNRLQIQIDESSFFDVYDELYHHLPYFLTDTDYTKLAAKFHPDTVDAIAQGIYKSLLTPGSSFVKKYAFRDPFGLTQQPLNKLQAFQQDEQFTIDDGYLRTTDGRALLFFIHPSNSSKETKNNAAFITQLDDYLAKLKPEYPELQPTYFGGVAVAVANATQIRRDVTLTVSIAVFCLFSLILYFFRKRNVFFQLIIPTVLGGLVAVAIMALLYDSISIIALGIGSVLLGITLDYSLHFFTHFRENGNVQEAIKDLSTSVMVSALTTAAAFLCLFLIRSEALRHLGLFAALAVILSATFSLIILPHMLKGRSYTSTETVIDRLARFRTHYVKPWMVLICLGTCVACFFIHRVAFEDDLNRINFMPEHLQLAEQKLNDVTSAAKRGIYILAQGNTLDEALEQNTNVDEQLKQLRANGTIADFESITSFLPSPGQQRASVRKWKDFWREEKIEKLQSYFGSAEKKYGFKAGTFHSFFDLIKMPIDDTKGIELPTLMSTVFGEFISTRNGKTTLLSIARIDEGMAPQVYQQFKPSDQIAIIDKGYLISRFIDILKNDFNRLVWWSFVIVFLLLHATYGRFELAIITMLPIGVSWILTLATMHFFDLKFNIVNIIITTFIFGLGIDYSIFIMRGLLHEFKYGIKHIHTFKTSIILSAATTLTGIGVMIIAKHPALRSIASISIIGILSVILVAFFIQPIIFRWLFTNRAGQRRPFVLSLTNIGYTAWTYFAELISWAIIAAPLVIIKLFGYFSKSTMQQLAGQLLHWRARFIRFSRSAFSWNVMGTMPPSPSTWSTNSLVTSAGITLTHALNPRFLFSKENKTSFLSAIYRAVGLTASAPKMGWHFIDQSPASDAKTTLSISGLQRQEDTHSIWRTPNDLIYQIGGNDAVPPAFYRQKLFENYLYRGNIIWYYMLVKVRLEKYYALFDQHIPKNAHIVDIGCGYGFMAYMLSFMSDDHTILGIDYDVQKIATANHCIHKSERLEFIQGDISTMSIPRADVYLLADILHYLPRQQQKDVFDRLAGAMHASAILIIRDGDADRDDKHGNTRWTEIFSTGLGFNKTKSELEFLSDSLIRSWAQENGLTVEVIERSPHTSNTVWLMRKNQHNI